MILNARRFDSLEIAKTVAREKSQSAKEDGLNYKMDVVHVRTETVVTETEFVYEVK